MPKVTVDLEVKNDKWSSTIGRSEKDLKSFVDKAQNSFKGLSFQKGASGFADAFLSASQAAEGFATSIRTGASAQKMLGDAINKVPIVGQFKQAGEAIGELIYGHKALRIEAEKLTTHLNAMADGYRAIAFAREGLGKYGVDKANLDADASTATSVSKLKEEQNKTSEELRANKKKNWIWDSAAEKAEMRRQQDAINLNTAQITTENQKNDQAHKDIKKNAGQVELEFDRRMDEQAEEFKAASEEKALRRQGKALESAIVATKAGAEARKRANLATLDDTKLEQLEGGKDGPAAQNRRKKVAEDNLRIDADAASTIASLKEDQDHKEHERTLDHEQSLVKIKREAQVDQLELTGNHLGAELLKIKGAAEDEKAALDKKYREEHNAMQADGNDPTLKGEREAVDLKEQNAEKLAIQKDAMEAEKKLNKDREAENKSWLEKQKKLQEEALTPVEKYKEKLEELIKARDDGMIDDKQFKALSDKEGDKTTKELDGDKKRGGVDSAALYGRQLDFNIPGQAAVGDTSKEILAQAKIDAQKTATRDEWIRRLYEKIVNPDSTPTALDIQGVMAA